MVDSDRSNEQCRSHHQKMLKRFGSIEEIIKHLGSQLTSSPVKIEEDRISSTQEEIVPAPMDELQDEIVNLEERNDGIEMVLVDEDEIPPIQKPFAFFDEESLPLFF